MKLKELQKRMQQAIMMPDAGVWKTEASNDCQWIEKELLASAKMSPYERLAIYQGMFQARVIDSLVDDYPLFHQLVDETTFESLCLNYIQEYPSRSFTLEKLGDHFSAFIAKQKPLLQGLPAAADIVKLEFAITCAFHAREQPVLTVNELQLDALDAWMDTQLRLVASASLLEFQYDVNSLYQAFLEERALADIEIDKKANFLLIFKKDDEIWRLVLSPLAYEFLKKLQSGLIMADAIDHVLASAPAKADIQSLFESFGGWVAAGVFQNPSQLKQDQLSMS